MVELHEAFAGSTWDVRPFADDHVRTLIVTVLLGPKLFADLIDGRSQLVQR